MGKLSAFTSRLSSSLIWYRSKKKETVKLRLWKRCGLPSMPKQLAAQDLETPLQTWQSWEIATLTWF